jgi:hypothetical protein
MTAAEKLRMEIAQEAPFSKDEFISKISRLIKAYGYNGIDLSNYTHCIIVKRNFYLAW